MISHTEYLAFKSKRLQRAYDELEQLIDLFIREGKHKLVVDQPDPEVIERIKESYLKGGWVITIRPSTVGVNVWIEWTPCEPECLGCLDGATLILSEGPHPYRGSTSDLAPLVTSTSLGAPKRFALLRPFRWLLGLLREMWGVGTVEKE